MWYDGGLVIVIVIKWGTKNITSSEPFLNPIGNGGKSLTLNTHIHDCSLSWHGTDTSIKRVRVKQFDWSIPSLLVKWQVQYMRGLDVLICHSNY